MLFLHRSQRCLYNAPDNPATVRVKNPTTPTVFESLVDSIVEQQIYVKVAHTIEQRLARKSGETLIMDGKTYFAYPTPQNIAVASVSETQQVGLSMRKAEPSTFMGQLS